MSLHIHDLICRDCTKKAGCAGNNYMSASGWRKHWEQNKTWQYLLPNTDVGCIVCGANDKLTCLSNIEIDTEEEMNELL